MNRSPEDAVRICGPRVRPIVDTAGAFLGTGVAVSPDTFITAAHVVARFSAVVVDGVEFRVHGLFLDIDLALLTTEEALDLPFFTVVSDPPSFHQDLIVVGWRLREGRPVPIAKFTMLGSVSERVLHPGTPPLELFGFSDGGLVEHGMSGGAVLRASDLALIGYVVGYDDPGTGFSPAGDDLCVSLAAAAATQRTIGNHLEFEHQHRATLINRARRYLSLSGFTVTEERLGAEPGLDQCLSAVRGAGVLASSLLLVVPTREAVRDDGSVRALSMLARERAIARAISFDRIRVLIDQEPNHENPRELTVTLAELRDAARIEQLSDSTQSSTVPALLGGGYIPRLVLTTPNGPPTDLFEQVKAAAHSGVRLVAIVGPLGGGKSTAIKSFHAAIEAGSLSKDIGALTCWTFSLLRDLPERLFGLAARDPGPAIICITEIDELWIAGEAASAVRKMRHVLAECGKTFNSWTVVLSLSGDRHQAQSLLVAAASDLPLGSESLVLDLLPLPAEDIKRTLVSDLGATLGAHWWQRVSASQEIFQIAEWPSGLSVLQDRAFQASWTENRTAQVALIAALVSGFLGRATPGRVAGPGAATLSYLVEIAKEINETQSLWVPINRARAIYARVFSERHDLQNLGLNDISVPGLLTHQVSPDSIGFGNPIFLHYLLAVAIRTSVSSLDVTNSNPLFHRRLPAALLADAVDLGIDEHSLWDLIEKLKEFPQEETAFIGGNCISLLRLMSADFSGRDFSGDSLRGAIFSGCNLTDARLVGARLVDVGFANSNLEGADFSGADLDRADLKSGCTIYQIAMAHGYAFAAASTMRLVRIKMTGGRPVQASTIEGFSDAVFAVAASEPARLLVAGGQDGTIRGWNLDTNEPSFVLRGHFSDVRALGFAGKQIISGSVDGRVNVWEPWTRSLVASIRPCGGEVWSIEMIDTSSAAVLCDRGHLHIIDIGTGSVTTTHELPSNCSRRIWRDANARLLVGGTGFVWALNLQRGEKQVIDVPHPSVRAIRHCAPNGYLLGGGYGQVVSANNKFSEFAALSARTADYVSDIAMTGPGQVIMSDASGRVSTLKCGREGWHYTSKPLVLECPSALRARRADFRSAKNLPEERRAKLGAAGAIV